MNDAITLMHSLLPFILPLCLSMQRIV